MVVSGLSLFVDCFSSVRAGETCNIFSDVCIRVCGGGVPVNALRCWSYSPQQWNPLMDSGR